MRVGKTLRTHYFAVYLWQFQISQRSAEQISPVPTWAPGHPAGSGHLKNPVCGGRHLKNPVRGEPVEPRFSRKGWADAIYLSIYRKSVV